MIIGIPKETMNNENRVALPPSGAERLVADHHRVLVGMNAGAGCGFQDWDYEAAGAQMVSSPAGIYEQADMIVKVKEPDPEELAMTKPDQIMFSYFHFAAHRRLTENFRETGGTAIAYETVQLPGGDLPLLTPMSEVAGRMAIQVGASQLEKERGGRGVLLGGIPGVRPANVTILGGGVVGLNAAKIAAGFGADVVILDIDAERLRYLDDIMPANVKTVFSHPAAIRDLLPQTDLLVGGVLIVGAKAPKLVTREMLGLMKKGAVIVDVSVDQGGCVETARPTTHEKPTYEVDGVIHYCVSNMPGAVPYTSTLALTNSTFPYIQKIAALGLAEALSDDTALQKGMNMYRGHVTHRAVADAFDLEFTEPLSLISLS